MNKVPVLEKWLRFHDTFVGWVFNHPTLPNGVHIQTGVIRSDSSGDMIDYLNGELHCADGMYKLGERGTLEDHDGPNYLGDVWKPKLITRLKLWHSQL